MYVCMYVCMFVYVCVCVCVFPWYSTDNIQINKDNTINPFFHEFKLIFQ